MFVLTSNFEVVYLFYGINSAEFFRKEIYKIDFFIEAARKNNYVTHWHHCALCRHLDIAYRRNYVF